MQILAELLAVTKALSQEKLPKTEKRLELKEEQEMAHTKQELLIIRRILEEGTPSIREERSGLINHCSNILKKD